MQQCHRPYQTTFIAMFTSTSFGSPIISRAYASLEYRYGFNGKELDKAGEGMGGGGNTYDYGFRIYNPNLGRFLSVDPLSRQYPELSSYQFANNKIIIAIDIDGLEEFVVVRWYDNNKLSHFTIIEVPKSERITPKGTLYIELDNTPANVELYKSLFKNNNEPNSDNLGYLTLKDVNWGAIIDKETKRFKVGNLEPKTRDFERNYWSRNRRSSKTKITRRNVIDEYKIFFENDEFTLDETDKKVLKNVAAWLSLDHNIKAIAYGNTDKDESEEYNRKLSIRRVKSALKHLREELNVQNEIEEKPQGEERSAQDEKKEEDRNVTIQIIYPAKGE